MPVSRRFEARCETHPGPLFGPQFLEDLGQDGEWFRDVEDGYTSVILEMTLNIVVQGWMYGWGGFGDASEICMCGEFKLIEPLRWIEQESQVSEGHGCVVQGERARIIFGEMVRSQSEQTRDDLEVASAAVLWTTISGPRQYVPSFIDREKTDAVRVDFGM